ncbi:MAG: response regulator [Chloroflexi bacterium]|nr:response regulator [Chloroflexota bacterium]
MHLPVVAHAPTTRPIHAPRVDTAPLALVVDDDPSIRTLVRYILEAEGIDVETARNGLEALVKIAHRRPSIVLLDLDMPGCNGEIVAHELRTRYGAELPLVVVSGNLEADEIAERLGVDQYVAKPFSRATILRAVQRALSRTRIG